MTYEWICWSLKQLQTFNFQINSITNYSLAQKVIFSLPSLYLFSLYWKQQQQKNEYKTTTCHPLFVEFSVVSDTQFAWRTILWHGFMLVSSGFTSVPNWISETFENDSVCTITCHCKHHALYMFGKSWAMCLW